MPTDLLLVNPNRMRPPIAPLALEYLAEAAREAGLRAAICDLCFADDPAAALRTAVKAHTPRLVAVTLRNADDCYCATRHSFLPDLRELLAALPEDRPPVVLGGAGYSTAPEAILEFAGADYGIAGDGEAALVALAGGTAIEAIPGLSWRQDGLTRRNPAAFGEFGQRPLSRENLDTRRYFREGGQAGLETKRGCPMSCVFCADPHSKGRASRLRPPEVVAQEAEHLLTLGADAIHLCDCEFNLPLDHAKAVCEAFIARGLGDRWRWWGYLSPVPFDEELVGLMVRSGCAGVNFGADSGDAAMLRSLGRAHTPEDLAATAALCQQHHLPLMYDLLLGGPGETRESLRTTIELMQRIGPDCVGIALGMRLYAGTAATEQVFREGFRAENPNLLGQVEGNDRFAWPVYYLESELGEDVVEYLRTLIGGDQRFFFGWPDEAQADYNYDDNEVLVRAIRDGARGAYWDILRRLA